MNFRMKNLWEKLKNCIEIFTNVSLVENFQLKLTNLKAAPLGTLNQVCWKQHICNNQNPLE